MTKISIALATYNGAAFLAEQLDSYVAQVRRPDELVVGDDGSTDETLALLNTFAATAPFAVRLLDGPSGGGIAANFERTIRTCSGELILLSDQDDIWLPDKIAVVEQAMAAAPGMLAIHHDEWLMDSDSGERLPVTMATRLRQLKSWEHFLYAANCMAIRASLRPIVLPIPQEVHFDDWLSLIPEALGTRLILDEPLQLWRRHIDNYSTPAAAEADPPGPWAMARRFGFGDPRGGWAVEREKLGLAAARIADTAILIDVALEPGRAAQAVRTLEQKITGIERRGDRLGLPRWRRWATVMAALKRGDYRQFSGWRSAAKDFIRTVTKTFPERPAAQPTSKSE